MRFIPAYAGNARRQAGCSASRSVHPRIRGERTGAARGNFIAGGSSPHTRGTLGGFFSRFCARRFIPAYAGNAVLDPRHAARPPVHPRIRGERARQGAYCRLVHGSSPHTRGTQAQEQGQGRHGRFIPAYAGNAVLIKLAATLNAVHPRIRGERAGEAAPSGVATGSSPHTRGTPGKIARNLGANRFIPAYAGNAFRRVPASGLTTVHPRIRGERHPSINANRSTSGSSPHTRGTRADEGPELEDQRFIPAYAGNASDGLPVPPRGPVHPRIRGERPCAEVAVCGIAGSSPHTRGTPPEWNLAVPHCRFIPAYAGNAFLGCA